MQTKKSLKVKNEVKAKKIGIKKEVKEHIIASTHKKKSNQNQIFNKKEISKQ